MTEYHRRMFERANRYYTAIETHGRTYIRRRRWRFPTATFIAGAAIALIFVSLVSPAQPALSVSAKLAIPVKIVSVSAPSHMTKDVIDFRQHSAYAEAHIRPKPKKIYLVQSTQISQLYAGYANPLRAIYGLIPERIDAGVDYGGTGPIYAVGPGIIQNTYNSGWPGGGFICEYLTGGRYAGWSVYVAEDVTATVSGGYVNANTVIGNDWGGIETGFAQGGCAGNALDGYYGYPTSAGYLYSQLVASLGAPPGIG